ncbi:hypothetical protein ACJMK2_017186 [Sinanodonta woodiana]|uniref:Cadherin domain-containing protein n=1 Tax=Sinanodonta woodiana TaxID=1069815 RepID=A0ABD3UXE8_SINWO
MAHVVSGDDPTAKFQLSGTQIQTTSNPINYESIGGQNYKYTLIVEARDPTLTGTATVYVTIMGVNEFAPDWGTFIPPASSPSGPSYTISENAGIGTTVVTLAATDDDSGTQGTVTFSIQSVTPNLGGSGIGLFHIDPVNGYLATIGTFDRDTATGGTEYYDVDVRATDGGGRFVDITIEVLLTDYNDNVPTFAQTVYSLSFSETKAAGSSLMSFIVTDKDETSPTLTFSIESGDTSGFFVFDATTKNQLNLNTAINLDSPDNHSPTYSLVIIVTDGGTPELTGTTYVTVTVLPANEYSPVFSATSPSSTVTLAENTAIGTSVATVAATDADYGNDGAVTYSIAGGNLNNKFQINPTTGIISSALSLDYETTTSYQLVIHAVDGGTTAITASTTVTISVTDINDNKPTCTTSVISTSISETANVADLVTTLTCSDRDVGNSISYSITSGNTGSAFRIDAATGAIAVNGALNYDSLTQTYSLVVEVTDGTNTLTVPVAISLTPVNEFTPTFSNSPSLTVAENESPGKSLITYTASDADYYPDGISSYTISAVSNSGSGKFMVNQLTGLINLATATLDYETLPAGAKYYEVIVIAEDGGGLKGTGTVTVSVTDVNDNAPSCSPASHVVSLPENTAISTTVIVAFGCSDADSGSILTYTLTQSPGTSFSLDLSGTPFLKVASALNYESVQSYELDLVVVDSGVPAKTTTVPIDIIITDVNDGGPTFSGSFTTSIAENSATGTSVADVTATDPDSNTSPFGKLKYSILSGDANNQFSINPETGRVSVSSSLDREMISSYSIVVQAVEEAGTNSATTTLSVTITDVNDNTPTCTQLTFSESFAESTSVGYLILTLTCSDADTATFGTLTYSISSGSTTFFQMSSNILQLKNVIDYEGGTVKFDLIITVSDGTRSVQVKGSIVVTDVNEATPVFTNSGSYSSTVAEDTSLGTLVTTVTANDADTANTVTYGFVSTYSLFSLDSSSGQIVLVGHLDREMTSIHTLLVTGSDGTNTATATVTITVTDVNDNAPIFNPVAYSGTVSEADAAGASTVATVTATDADDPNTNNNGKVTYSILSGGGGVFSIGTISGAITTTTQLDYETATSYTLIIKAVDKGGAAGSHSATAVVTITVTNINEAAPIFGLTTYSASIPENTNVGTSVVQVVATDLDSGDDGKVYYSMAANANFYLDSYTGIIYVKSALDYETSTLYSLTILAIDNGTPARTGTATVSVSVTDVNDNRPSCSPTLKTLTYPENQVTATTFPAILCTDADSGINSALTYSISTVNNAAPGSQFSIASATGIIMLDTAFDFEMTSAYSILVRVADGGTPSQSTTITYDIAITDINEHTPAFTAASYSINVPEDKAIGYVVLTVTATDGDTSDSVVYYFSPSSPAFEIDGHTGDVKVKSTLDRETTSSYTITVYALDTGTSPSSRSSSSTISITITNTNDVAPIFNPAVYVVSIPENTGVGTTVKSVTAADADDTIITYSITAGNTGTAFRIETDASYIGNLIVDATLDYEVTTFYTVTVVARDPSGLSSSVFVSIQITGYNEGTPTFSPSSSSTKTVVENSAIGSTVVDLNAIDTDAGNDGLVEYAIVSGASGAFAIDPSTGIVTVSGSLDMETTQIYTVLIKATDAGSSPGPLSSTYTLTVSITDVNDKTPSCTSSLYSASVSEDASSGTSVTQITCTDNDFSSPNKDLSYAITNGNSGTAFSISSTGEVTTVNSLDRETTSNYLLVIEVTDLGTPAFTTTTTLTITVTDVNDNAPVFTGGPTFTASVSEGSALGHTVITVSASDADTGLAGAVGYSIFSGNAEGKFGLSRSTGDLEIVDLLDYETTSSYTLVLYAVDKGASPHTASATVSITVTNVNDNTPSCSAALYVGTVSEDAVIGTSVVTLTCSDNDAGTTLTYMITDGDISNQFIMSGMQVQTQNSLDAEVTSSYLLTVQVSDGTLKTNITVSVSVTDVNDNGPTFNPAGPYAVSFREDSNIGTLIYDLNATDADISSGTFYFSITNGNTDNVFTISESTGVIQLQKSIDREKINSYVVSVEVADGVGSGSFTSTATLTVTVTDVNDNYPTCNATVYTTFLDENVAVSTKVAIPSCSDVDMSSPIMLYSIVAGDPGSLFSINTATGEILVNGVLDYETKTSHVLSVTVDDQGSPGLTTTIQVTVWVNPINEYDPSISISYTASVAENAAMGYNVVQVSATDNDLGSNHGTIRYSIIAGNNNALFSIYSSDGQISVAGNLDRETSATHTLTVAACDGTAGSPDARCSNTVVTITVIDVNDNYPVFNPSTYSVSVLENATVGGTIVRVTATDSDDALAGTSGLQYSIVDGNSAGKFSMSGSSITLSGDIDSYLTAQYQLKIQASDQGTPSLSSFTYVTVSVIAVNEYSPSFSVSGDTVTVPEDELVGTSLYTFIATDQDTGKYGELRYSITSGNADSSFLLDEFTGKLLIWSQLDYDTHPQNYVLIVKVMDNQDNYTNIFSATFTLTIILTDVNDHSPVFHNGGVPTSSYTIYLDENVSVGYTVTSLVVASDADSGVNGNIMYTIVSGDGASVFLTDVSTGVITTNAAIDYETKSQYSLIVQAADGGTPSKSTVCSVLIHINDLNDNAPVFQTSNFALAISEASAVGTSVTKVTATDADSSANNNNVVRYSLTPTTYFSIVSTTGIIRTAAALDRETIASHTLTVLAIDQGTNPSAKTGTTTVTVILNDVNDNNPVITGTYDKSIAEDTSINTVVFQITATDADKAENALLTYTITAGNTNTDFKIDSSLGIIQVQNALDRETTNTYHLKVIVSDNGATPRSATTTATVTILDINDNNPLFTASSFTFSVSENVPTTTSVARLTVTDRDINLNGAFTISIPIFWKGTASHFTIHSTTGVISTAGSLDREALPEYQFLVRAIDGGTPRLSSEANVTITISDYNDNPPVFGNTTYAGSTVENQPVGTSVLTVVVTDADIGINAAITLSIDTSTGNGVTANQYLKVDSVTFVISVKQVIDRETVSSFSFNLIATDGGTPTMSATTSIRITILDVNDNDPIFSSGFYNSEIAYNDGCQLTITTVTASDADAGANAEVSYYFTQNNYPTLFSLDGNTGGIKLFATATSGTMYRVDVAAKDNGSPQRTSSTASTVRIDTYSPNSVIIAFYLDINKTRYTSIETTFLSQLTAVYRVTYSTAEAKRWCVTELSSASCKVLIYVIKDDSASTFAALNVAKPFLTSDEAYNIAAKDSVGTPANNIVGPGWYNFNITKVEKYYVVESASSEKPWIQTTTGIAVVSTCSFVALLALIGITIAIVRYLRKNKGHLTFKFGNITDSEVQPFNKSHSPSAVVAMPVPISNSKVQPKTLDNNNPWKNYPRRKLPSQTRGKSENQDPMKEEDYRGDSNTPGDQYSPPPPYWNSYSRQPLIAPMLPQQAPSTTVLPRTDIPGTPLPQEKQKYVIINREFDGRAIDPATGKLYEYNTKTNERRWISTPDGKEVKLASETS